MARKAAKNNKVMMILNLGFILNCLSLACIINIFSFRFIKSLRQKYSKMDNGIYLAYFTAIIGLQPV
ncbi:MAG: hypothetical protein CVT99_08330 [Bacteroidetes bacterium HGW-Bacteroidetes-16]|nr:MAG: hypothetical protein CVT99_08330 [Bacteroidetes bacterium HGW-Bacteroidetes-16]